MGVWYSLRSIRVHHTPQVGMEKVMVLDTSSTLLLLLSMWVDVVDVSSSRAPGNDQEAALAVEKAGVFGF